MIAYLFSISLWQFDPPIYLLVYAETERQAREIGAAQCHYNSRAPVKPEDLKLQTFGL